MYYTGKENTIWSSEIIFSLHLPFIDILLHVTFFCIFVCTKCPFSLRPFSLRVQTLCRTQPTMYTSLYTTDAEHVREMLSEYGVAVLPAVLDETECKALADGVWASFEWLCQKMTPVLKRADPTTHTTLKALLPHHHMLFQQYINHMQAVWDVRQNPKVHAAFQNVWNTTSKMLVSFDGLSLLPPYETSGYGVHEKGAFPLHTDQSLQRKDFECIQGMITAHEVSEGDATLVVMPGSHKLHRKFRQKFYPEPWTWDVKTKKLMSGDWFKFEPAHLAWFATRGCHERYITCPAGSLILWDSRTTHCGRLPSRVRPHPHERLVVYVCMTPASRCDEKHRLQRIKKFEALRGTTHWPHKAKLFPVHPSTYHRRATLPDIMALPPPQLTPLGRSLVGYLDEDVVEV